ncbi:hypothetical protein Taro_040294 [Colocasia esculenta]|uniref:Uncharacterized protein n=1 Tax=Colocasia esculenta TaxID=4460 RepID=A0A843W8L4_COLES|nr:hypothetical protein [Colocasia esculenta]
MSIDSPNLTYDIGGALHGIAVRLRIETTALPKNASSHVYKNPISQVGPGKPYCCSSDKQSSKLRCCERTANTARYRGNLGEAKLAGPTSCHLRSGLSPFPPSMAAGIGGVIRLSFVLAVLLLLMSESSLAYTARRGRGGEKGAVNCREVASKVECERNSKWCRWCTSDALDDMCFGAAEAWRLPQQGKLSLYSSRGLEYPVASGLNMYEAVPISFYKLLQVA